MDEREQLNRYFDLPKASRMNASTMSVDHRQLYHRVLAELTPTQRRTFINFFLCGIAANMIADAEGVTPVAVRRRLVRIAEKFVRFGLPAPSRFILYRERHRELQLSQLIEGVHF